MRNEQNSKEQVAKSKARGKELYLNFAPCSLLLALCYLLFACKSPPKAPEQTLLESGIAPLEKGAAAYALVDVPNARPILEGINFIPANDRNVKLMLDRTKSAALAVFSPSSAEDRRYQLVSWGSYPASGSSIAFGTSKDWTKQRSASLNMIYWHSEKSQMSVAVSPSQAYVLVAMTKIPHDPIPSPEGIKIPGGFGEFARDSVFSCWLSDPGPVLNQRLKGMGVPLEIPAEQLFISMFPSGDQASAKQPAYEAQIKITLPGEAQAKTVVSLLSLARAFMPPPLPPSPAESADSQDILAQKSAAMMAYILYANPIIQEGAGLLLKSPPLSARDISLLFSIFSL